MVIAVGKGDGEGVCSVERSDGVKVVTSGRMYLVEESDEEETATAGRSGRGMP